MLNSLLAMMDVTDSATFLLIILLLASLLLVGFRRKSTGKLPPGPWKYPILGNLPQLAGSLPHRAMRDLANKYGPIMHLRLGEVSHVVVSSPGTAKEVMKTHDLNFASRPEILFAEVMLYDNTGITFSPSGEYWRQLKKMCASELLSAKRVKSFRFIREEETFNSIRWISCNEGKSINLTEAVFSLIFSITSRITFGKKSPEQDKLINIVNQASQLAAGANVCDLYPSIKFLRSISPVNKKLKKMFLESDRLLEIIVNDHIRESNTKCEREGDDPKDLVDVLLKCQKENSELRLTKQNIKAVLLDIFIGGTDGSANTVNWAMSEMIREPRILKRAQGEVRQAFGSNGNIDEEKFEELNYIKSIIKETLRLHPPAPLLVPRQNNEKTQLLGYEIPAKSKVLVNAWAINRDPMYWEEEESFKPERFLDSSVDFKGTHFQFVTFGVGRRMCPGIAYGIANVVHPLVKFLYYFDWNLPSGIKHDELDMKEEHGLAVRRKDDLYLSPVVWNSLEHP